MKVITSKKFRLNLLDLAKGFLVAFITAIITGCGEIFEIYSTSPTFSFDKFSITMMIKTGLIGGAAYLVKQFFTPAKVIIKGDDVTNEVVEKIQKQEEKNESN